MAEEQNRTLDAQYLLRLTSSLRDRIKAAAAENNRSMNAEIVATLEEKFPPPKPPSEFPMDQITSFMNDLAATDSAELRDEKIAKFNAVLAPYGLRLKWTIPTEELPENYGRALYVTTI